MSLFVFPFLLLFFFFEANLERMHKVNPKQSCLSRSKFRTGVVFVLFFEWNLGLFIPLLQYLTFSVYKVNTSGLFLAWSIISKKRSVLIPFRVEPVSLQCHNFHEVLDYHQ